MNLTEKILTLHSELTKKDFNPLKGTIVLQNDSDGNGDYIAQWNHPTLPRPTEEQLA
jgi:hypothetical protein